MLLGSGQALAECPCIHRLTCSRYLQGSLKSRRLRAPQQELWPRAIIGCHQICRTGTLHAWREALCTEARRWAAVALKGGTHMQGGLQAIGVKLHPMESNWRYFSAVG